MDRNKEKKMKPAGNEHQQVPSTLILGHTVSLTTHHVLKSESINFETSQSSPTDNEGKEKNGERGRSSGRSNGHRLLLVLHRRAPRQQAPPDSLSVPSDQGPLWPRPLGFPQGPLTTISLALCIVLCVFSFWIYNVRGCVTLVDVLDVVFHWVLDLILAQCFFMPTLSFLVDLFFFSSFLFNTQIGLLGFVSYAIISILLIRVVFI